MIILDKWKYTIYVSEKKDGTAREIKDFIYTKQVHGNALHILDKKIEFIDSENDGIISEIPKIKVWVLLADCNGILLMGKRWYGAIHAWRKGLQNGMIEKALDRLKNYDEDIAALHAYIGPSIRACCYEVGDEFLGYFNKKYFSRRDWKLYFNMIAMIKDILRDADIPLKNIEIHTDCTACSWRFFSYRKSNKNQRIVVAVEKK